MAKDGKIGIIGLGLIGGSLALALRERYDVLGCDSDPETENTARGAFCEIADIADMRGCKAVFVCVPVKDMSSALSRAYNALGDGTIITDVASVKTPFINSSGRYVGGHPMAGTERGGISAAKPHLFQNAYWVITGSGSDARTVCDIVRQTGALPVFMTAEEHDRAVAAFSHTPHAAAYAMTVAATENSASPIAGSGFLDSTRIAKSDEKFWTEVFLQNAQNVSDGIRALVAELEKLRAMIDGGERKALCDYLCAAKSKRIALDRADLGGDVLYVDLVDRVGEFERVTGAVSHAGINMKNIALVPARDGAGGALCLEFESAADREKAAAILYKYKTDRSE